MRPPVPVAVLAAAFMMAGVMGRAASAQNDWQFPDPYFGAIEIQKSHPLPKSRQNRSGQQPPLLAPPPLLDSPATTNQTPPARPRLFRGRGRWAGRGTTP